jgi:hypothetical protein
MTRENNRLQCRVDIFIPEDRYKFIQTGDLCNEHGTSAIVVTLKEDKILTLRKTIFSPDQDRQLVPRAGRYSCDSIYRSAPLRQQQHPPCSATGGKRRGSCSCPR